MPDNQQLTEDDILVRGKLRHDGDDSKVVIVVYDQDIFECDTSCFEWTDTESLFQDPSWEGQECEVYGTVTDKEPTFTDATTVIDTVAITAVDRRRFRCIRP